MKNRIVAGLFLQAGTPWGMEACLLKVRDLAPSVHTN